MDTVNAVLQPDFHSGYCDYFFYLMVIYLIIGTLTVADFALSGVANIKNFSGFMRNHMGSKVLQLVTIGVHFFRDPSSLQYVRSFSSCEGRYGLFK